MNTFCNEILAGIPQTLPELNALARINPAPKRSASLSVDDKILALQNALRYIPTQHHAVLAKEFAEELKIYGHIYMYRYRPTYQIKARHIAEFPCRSKHAAAIMLMLCNNLDTAVAQHPEELITYGGNGAVFQNWAQYRLTMKYLAELEDDQTLVLYSGHPLGVFPSHPDAPRLIITNGMMIPNYSKPEHLDKYYALGVTQYGQMTAGSFMYIGPQGIVHGTTLTVLNAGRIRFGSSDLAGKLYVSSGLGGMSGAQPKAGVIAGAVSVIAEINPEAIQKRYQQGWLNESYTDLPKLLLRIKEACSRKEAVSLGYQGNVVDLWESLVKNMIQVDLGSDQTSLHNPYGGGYYPCGISFEESKKLLTQNPERFKLLVKESLVRQVNAINTLTKNGMYFFDYGNAFLLEASRAGADILNADGSFKYPSYIEDILGPRCFDYGFGPFRWICTSCDPADLDKSDVIAGTVLEEVLRKAPAEISQQLQDNLEWIRAAKKNNLVVGSQARILYADAEARMKIAEAFNQAIASGEISAPVVLGRDHHDVSGTDSPYRETSNIRDGSKFTADMAVQNVIGDSFRGATWVSLHNGGGVGWGEVINGGFGLVLDGSPTASRKLKSMLFWDVNNGIARRSWARNPGAMTAIERAMQSESRLKITMPNLADRALVSQLFK